jgi:hypothetical protein
MKTLPAYTLLYDDARPLYDWFARNCYRLGGYNTASCAGDACAAHLGGVPTATQ